MTSARYGSLPFQQQIDIYRSKVPMPTRAWTDLYGAEHDHAAVVAGANRMAIIEDFQQAIASFIEEGKTLADFRQAFDDIVKRHGWAYNGGRNWRTRIIYETNLRQSYQAGREQQMADPALRKARPYGLYRHGGSSDPREDHLKLNNTVVLLDNPWWEVWTPQNGWGCTCKKFMVSERDVQRLGLKVLDTPPAIEYETRTVGVNGPNPRTVRVPKGIDPGFEYRPGASRLRSTTATPLDEPVRGLPERLFPPNQTPEPLPAPRPYHGQLLPAGQPEQDYARAFLQEFNADLNAPRTFTDVTGEPLMISEELFKTRKGTWKIVKQGRERYLPLLAMALKDPDEIWVAAEWHGATAKPVLRRRYVAEFDIAGQEQPGVAVFEWGRDGWAGITTYQADQNRKDELAQFRQGVRLYRRTP
ncbi:PBECR2 nuclease fold domain-containing protein [Spongiibacter sp. UBA1325]|uniref:PBECR2 nuclease fold domain-containing protein n=1 Tax=Spongiibacter sp. UBA1325 TaxID=1947543 RepID=UPI002579FD61|nr:PBECR2 nuclease fold domain-containing protein [Spongiibacter sp. UBA1325]|tara:strand:- start:8669 stop:9916 length:1248 start_codon:yes stop_codon:yes gene_type:complete